MNLFKNHTPYKGKTYLKIERSYPHYSSGKHKLNKFYFKVFGLNVSSRITIERDEYNNYVTDPIKKDLIEIFTGGHIDGDTFVSKDGSFVGDVFRAWWYYQNHFKVDDEYPHGVASVWDETYSFITGYYGYTHRGGQTFKVGDRLFDQKYEPIEEDYEEWQWAGWELDFEKRKSEWSEGIADIIPFTMRGYKTIENLAEAKEAARNLSNYLS
jgi:hypothetical protein